jgi:hypothetical protein
MQSGECAKILFLAVFWEAEMRWRERKDLDEVGIGKHEVRERGGLHRLHAQAVVAWSTGIISTLKNAVRDRGVGSFWDSATPSSCRKVGGVAERGTEGIIEVSFHVSE